MNKLRVESASKEELEDIISRGLTALEQASIDQLRATVIGLSTTVAQMTTEADEATTYGLAMDVMMMALRENVDAASLETVLGGEWEVDE